MAFNYQIFFSLGFKDGSSSKQSNAASKLSNTATVLEGSWLEACRADTMDDGTINSFTKATLTFTGDSYGGPLQLRSH